jgi:hypothetical protein
MQLINPEIIMQKYRAMADEELLHLLKQEATDLTRQAFVLLMQECRRRNIGTAEMSHAAMKRAEAEAVNEVILYSETVAGLSKAVWRFAIDAKANGMKNQELFDALRQRNIAADSIVEVLAGLKLMAQEGIAECKNYTIIGWLTVAVGLLVVFFSIFSSALQGYFVLWGALFALGGFYRLYLSVKQEEKFSRVIRNVEAEEGPPPELYQ